MYLKPNGYIINDPAELWPGYQPRDYGFIIKGNQTDYIPQNYKILDVLTTASATAVLPLYLFVDGEDYVVTNDHIYKKNDHTFNGILVSGKAGSTDGIRLKNGPDGLEVHITDDVTGIKIADAAHYAAAGNVTDWSWGTVAGYLVFSYPMRSIYTQSVVNLNWMYQYAVDLVGKESPDLDEINQKIQKLETEYQTLKTETYKISGISETLETLQSTVAGLVKIPDPSSAKDTQYLGVTSGELVWKDLPEGGGGGTVTVDVGETTTVEYPEEASVTNSGNEQNVTLDFKIPRGQKGENGRDGETPEINISATSDTGDVTVDKSGSGALQSFKFNFSNLSGGETGIIIESVEAVRKKTSNDTLDNDSFIDIDEDFEITGRDWGICYYTCSTSNGVIKAPETVMWGFFYFNHDPITAGLSYTEGQSNIAVWDGEKYYIGCRSLYNDRNKGKIPGGGYLNAIVIRFS